jgi:hypothetical protein
MYLKRKTALTLPVIATDSTGKAAAPTYKSSKTKVATVSKSGKVSAKRVGSATITISLKGATSVKVKVNVVKKAKALKSVKATGAPTSIAAGATKVIGVSLSPASATGVKVSFASSNTKVLTINKAGVSKGIRPGKATVTIKAGKKSVKKTITVTAAAAASGISAQAYSVSVPGLSSYRVNYAVLTLPKGSSGYSATLGGEKVTLQAVVTGGTVVRIPVKAGVTSAALVVSHGGVPVLERTLAFAAGGKTAPVALYGTTPMNFSEYFHDVTTPIGLPAGVAFGSADSIATPRKFISQGTRTGTVVGGSDTLTYAEGDLLGKVDTVSTATYGDGTHFAPNGNLTLIGNRETNTDPNKAIARITAVEVSADFGLYANAEILRQRGQATLRSSNVLAQLRSNKANFTLANVQLSGNAWLSASGSSVAAPSLYKAKALLVDGNWGVRKLVNAATVKPLPGVGNGGETEDISYYGTWADVMTGFSFGDAATLTPDYSGANYWDNFANNIYGGIITDQSGNKEPLVFMQNLFTHRMHEDFDVALSPSRFARLYNLDYPGTYHVQVFTKGFEDVEFDFSAKIPVNPTLALTGGGAIQVSDTTQPIVKTITGVEDAASYIAGAALTKGAAGVEVASNLYTLTDAGAGSVTLTLQPGLLTGSWWDSYSLTSETAAVGSKALSFSLINPVVVDLVTDATGGTSAISGGSAYNAPYTVSSPAPLYFSDTNFAAAVNTAARGGSTIQQVDAGTGETIGAAVAAGSALAFDAGSSGPYHINTGSALFESGKTYRVTVVATGFNSQVFYLAIP